MNFNKYAKSVIALCLSLLIVFMFAACSEDKITPVVSESKPSTDNSNTEPEEDIYIPADPSDTSGETPDFSEDDDDISSNTISNNTSSNNTSSNISSSNENKTDTDADGKPNDKDPDIDGDGVENDKDSDMDGDGTINDKDPDVDGDGTENEDDTIPEGPGSGKDDGKMEGPLVPLK